MISVCMATYNGERYIKEQLDSIIRQLSEGDEIIISDDGSTDATLEIARACRENFPGIVIVAGPKKGVVRNFENALHYAKGDIIFLSDQDDIWEDNKYSTVLNVFEQTGCRAVVHDASFIDGQGRETGASFFEWRGSRPGFMHNLAKNSYLGCCMAFRADMLEHVFPFPEKIEMHDWWIGMLSEMKNGSVYIPDKLLRYRRHDGNVSAMHHHPVGKMIYNRVYLLWNLAKRRPQVK